MNKEIEKLKRLPVESSKNRFDFHGPGTNIGVTQTVNVTNIYQNIQFDPTIANNQGNINFDYYSLFVIAGETFSHPNNYFILPLDRALTVNEGTPINIHEKLALFDDQAIYEIKSYLAIFTAEDYRYTPPDTPINGTQKAYYGFIQDIVRTDRIVKISYEIHGEFEHSILSDNFECFGLNGNHKINELDRTHWTIKKINIVQELKNRGIKLRITSYQEL